MGEPARTPYPDPDDSRERERARARFRDRAHAPMVVIGGGGDRVERETLTLSTPPPTTTPKARARTRRAPLSARLLARWLREELRTVGADTLIRQHGTRAVIDALYDGVVCEEPVYDTEQYQSAPGVQRSRTVEVGRRRVLNDSLRNPGGYLRWVLDQEAQR